MTNPPRTAESSKTHPLQSAPSLPTTQHFLVGSFEGFMHYLPVTAEGYAAETWLTDQSGEDIHISQYWGKAEKNGWK